MAQRSYDLVESEVKRSLTPPGLILTCRWRLVDGDKVTECYSSTIVTPDALCDQRMWDDMFEQVQWWYAAKQRKNGEIACLRT